MARLSTGESVETPEAMNDPITPESLRAQADGLLALARTMEENAEHADGQAYYQERSRALALRGKAHALQDQAAALESAIHSETR